MIDIKRIRELQEEKIDIDMEKSRISKIAILDSQNEKRKEELEILEQAKMDAENALPATLNAIEERIASDAKQGKTSLQYEIGDTNISMHLAIFLFHIFPLSGLICKIRDNKLTISW